MTDEHTPYTINRAKTRVSVVHLRRIITWCNRHGLDATVVYQITESHPVGDGFHYYADVYLRDNTGVHMLTSESGGGVNIADIRISFVSDIPLPRDPVMS